MSPSLALLVSILWGQPGSQAAPAPAALPPAAAEAVDFVRDIKPILHASCARCHARGTAKGGFSIETREAVVRGGDGGPAVVPGRSGNSLLVELVAGLDPERVMPQKGSRLTPAQIGLLRAWIDQGLGWDASVSFARTPPQNLIPRQPALPPGPSTEHPVDRLLAPYLAAQGAARLRPADDRALVRRLYFDVVGEPPSPEDVRAFLADRRPDRQARLIGRLLADRARYATHWLSFWNDALRNDYKGTGYIDGGRLQISAWLYSALARNVPYDHFVSQLIDPAPGAEGFTKGIVWRGVVNASERPEMQAAQNLAQVFMGVNLKCASCHDSFVNDWQLADAYGLAAIYAEGPLELVECDRPTGRQAAARFLYPELGVIDAASKPERTRQLARLMTGRANGRLSRTIVNRLWARFMGRGLVEPLDDMDRPAWHPDLLDWLAEDLVAHGYNLQHTIGVILTSRAYAAAAVDLPERAGPYVFRGPAVRRLSAEQFADALAAVTGVFKPKPDGAFDFTAAGVTDPAAAGRTRAALVAADPLMTALGRPNREQVVTARLSAPTTLQALELANGATLATALEEGARRLVQGSPRADDLVALVYERALGRRPTQAETRLCRAKVGTPVGADGVEDLLWAIVMLPEFQFLH